MKASILIEIEGIGPPAVADLPLPGDIRRRLEVITEADQTAEDITEADQTAEELHDILVRGGLTGDSRVKGERVNAVEMERPALGSRG